MYLGCLINLWIFRSTPSLFYLNEMMIPVSNEGCRYVPFNRHLLTIAWQLAVGWIC